MSSKIITHDSNIFGGKAIISGTRISVEVVLELLSTGLTVKDVLEEYPFLSEEQVNAAIKYAAQKVGKEETYTFKGSVTAHDLYRRH